MQIVSLAVKMKCFSLRGKLSQKNGEKGNSRFLLFHKSNPNLV